MAEPGRPVGYEGRDAHVRGVIAAALGIAVMVALAAGAAWILVRLSGGNPPAARPAPVPDGASLQTAPAADLAAFRREKAERLDGYGWVDHSAGRVHIPIERAMAIVAARGDPSQPLRKDGR